MGDIYRIGGIVDASIKESDGNKIDIPFGNSITVEPDFETITFEGDGQQVEDYYGLRLTGAIAGDKFSEDVLEALYGIAAVTSGTGIDGVETKRWYMGSDSELAPPQVELNVDMHAIKDDDESSATVRVKVFKARVRPLRPPEGVNADKFAPHSFEYTAEKATTDIEGNPLPGAPSGGAYYSLSVLA